MQSAASAADDNACSLYSTLQARCANTLGGCSNQQAIFVDMIYTPQLRAPFSVIRLTTHLNLCMPRFTDLQNRMRKVLPCPVCLQSVSRRHSVVLNGCKHVLCKACLIQYLESAAGDNRNPRCVMPQCQQALDMEQCQVVLHQHKPVSPACPPDCHSWVKASSL